MMDGTSLLATPSGRRSLPGTAATYGATLRAEAPTAGGYSTIGGYYAGYASPAGAAFEEGGGGGGGVSDFAKHGGGGGSGEYGALPRAAFGAFLSWRSSRSKVLRQVPVSLALYVVFAVGMLLRARIADSYTFESSLLAGVVNAGDGFAPSSAGDWFDWVDGTLVGSVLPATDYNGVDLAPARLGRLSNGLGLLLGGVRLLQTRRATVSCPMGSSQLNAVFGGACYGDDATTSEAFGNVTAADEAGVGSAFSAYTVDGDDEGARYQLFLNPEDGAAAMSGYVNGLRSAYWLDAGTMDASVQMALLNGNTGMFGRVELTASFTRGGLVEASTSVLSLPVDPYWGEPWSSCNILFDMVTLLYFLYLAAGTLRRLAKAGCSAPGPLGARTWNALASYWRLLDVASVASLFATLVTWFHVVDLLARIRNSIDDANPTGPADFAGGPSALAQNLYDAHTAFASFKLSAVATVRRRGVGRRRGE